MAAAPPPATLDGRVRVKLERDPDGTLRHRVVCDCCTDEQLRPRYATYRVLSHAHNRATTHVRLHAWMRAPRLPIPAAAPLNESQELDR